MFWGYDPIVCLADAMRFAQSIDQDKVAAALVDPKFECKNTGSFTRWGKTLHDAASGNANCSVVNGQAKCYRFQVDPLPSTATPPANTKVYTPINY